MNNFNNLKKRHKINFYLIQNHVNADKLFLCLLEVLETRGFDFSNPLTIKDISNLIPRGAAGISNYSTYGFSFMSMLSGQNNRDYFIFTNKRLREEFTSICNNNHDRDNYAWKKHYLNEQLIINSKYIEIMD